MLVLLDPIAYDPHHHASTHPDLATIGWRWLLSSPLPVLTVAVGTGIALQDAFTPRVPWWPLTVPLLLVAVAHIAAPATWRRPTLVLLGLLAGVTSAAWHGGIGQVPDQTSGTAVFRVDSGVGIDSDGGRRATVVVEAFGAPDGAMVPDGRRYLLRLPPSAPPTTPGDRFAARARRSPPWPRLFPGAPDLRRGVAARGAVGQLRLAGPLVPMAGQPGLISGIDSQRQRAHQLLVNHSPGGVLPALALGQGRTVKPEIRALYGRCGLAHVLAVSGLHFGLVALVIFGLARKLAGRSAWVNQHLGARRVAVAVAVPLLCLYVAYVGAPVSARRACIMAVCLLVGHVIHREGHPVISLSAAALIILLLQPAELFSPGFQLSFSAVLGLLWTAQNYEKPIRSRIANRLGRWSTPVEWIASSLIATIGASMTTLPFVLYHFGQVPLVGMLANVWVVPAVSFVLLPQALLSAALVDIWPQAATLIASSGGQCETWLTASVAWFDSAAPLVAIDSSRALPVGLLVVYAAGAGSWLLAPSHMVARFLAVPALIAVFTVHLVAANTPAHQGTLRVTFISIGQGDATLVEFPDGQSMLIDAGGVPGGDFDTGARVVLPFLRAIGRTRVDVVVLTHPDFDHMGGLASVIRAVHPREVWTNGDTLPSDAWADLMAAVEETGARQRTMNARVDPMNLGGVRLQILWPDTLRPSRGRNDNSIVIRLDYGAASFILPGDAEVDAEHGMLARGAPLGATVLKSGHHGSRTSNSAAMLDAVHPRLLIYSVGEGNKFGFPHPEVTRRAVGRGIGSYRTDRDGTIRMETDGARMVVETWRD